MNSVSLPMRIADTEKYQTMTHNIMIVTKTINLMTTKTILVIKQWKS